jgi:predicted secreted protein
MRKLALLLCLLLVCLTILHPALPIPTFAAVSSTDAGPDHVASSPMTPTDTHVVTVILSTLIPVILYLLKESYPQLFAALSKFMEARRRLAAPQEDVQQLSLRIERLEKLLDRPSHPEQQQPKQPV